LLALVLLGGVISISLLPAIPSSQKPTVALTGTLVVVTAYYAWQSARMNQEMQRARSAQFRPKIVLSVIGQSGPVIAPRLTIENVGAGAALAIDVVFAFGPAFAGPGPVLMPDTASDEAPLPARWRYPLLKPGTGLVISNAVIAPFAGSTGLYHNARELKTVRLAGSCSDALGNVHDIDETLNLDHTISQWVESEVAPSEIGHALEHALRPIERALDPIASHFRWRWARGRHEPDTPTEAE
jgi:hypothetical protein